MAAMNCPYEYVFPKVSSQVQTAVDLVPGNLAIAIISLHYLHIMYSHRANFCLHYLHVMYAVIMQMFVFITYT